MKEGIYNVVFESHDASFGEGILVVSQGTVNGGDIGFIYQGKLQRPVMTLRVRQYQPDILSVLGMEESIRLRCVMRRRKSTRGITGLAAWSAGCRRSKSRLM